jgi:hypothetical protein
MNKRSAHNGEDMNTKITILTVMVVALMTTAAHAADV